MEIMRRPIFNVQTRTGILSHLNYMKWRLLSVTKNMNDSIQKLLQTVRNNPKGKQ